MAAVSEVTAVLEVLAVLEELAVTETTLNIVVDIKVLFLRQDQTFIFGIVPEVMVVMVGTIDIIRAIIRW